MLNGNMVINHLVQQLQNFLFSPKIAFVLMMFFLKVAFDLSSHEHAFYFVSFFMLHIGFFIVWQPVVDKKNKLTVQKLLGLVFLLAAFLLSRSWWIIFLWLLIIVGMISGKVQNFKHHKWVDAYSVFVVLFFFLVFVLPQKLLGADIFVSSFQSFCDMIYLFLVFLIVFFPARFFNVEKIDYFSALSSSVCVLIFSMSVMIFFHAFSLDYLSSVFSAVLFFISFILFSEFFFNSSHDVGVKQIWTKYILSSGIEYDKWTAFLTDLSINKKIEPDEFLFQSVHKMCMEIPVSGISVIRNSDAHQTTQLIDVGEHSKHALILKDKKIEMMMYSKTPLSSILTLHYQLLMRMVLILYLSKEREYQLIQQNHLKAVYETGSKLTHDVKNILQSLYGMTQIVESEGVSQEKLFLIQQQIPLLTQRLKLTLDKFRFPKNYQECNEKISILQWWKETKARFQDRHIIFNEDIEGDALIFSDALDTVIDNLIENARYKRMQKQEIVIEVHVVVHNQSFSLSVIDSGSPVPKELEKKLFNQIVSSKEGYGIGLLQSYRYAHKNGYELKLVENNPGKVVFTLSGSGV